MSLLVDESCDLQSTIDGVYLGDIGNGVVTYGTLCPYIKE